MAKGLPYYPLYVQDFDENEHVMAMTLQEVGLYLLALNSAWRFGSIPDDYLGLALLVRHKPNEVKKSWEKVRARFVESELLPGRLVNPRQEAERIKAREKSGKASGAARLSHAEGVRTQSGRRADAPANAERTHERTHLQRASESESVSLSDAFDTTSTEEKPSTRTRADLTVKPPEVPDCGPVFKRYIAAFLAAGVKLSEQDIVDAARGDSWGNVGFIQHSPEDQLAIAEAAEETAQTCNARTMGLPVNFTGKGRWRRRGPGRLLPDVRDKSRSQAATEEASRRVFGAE